MTVVDDIKNWDCENIHDLKFMYCQMKDIKEKIDIINREMIHVDDILSDKAVSQAIFATYRAVNRVIATVTHLTDMWGVSLFDLDLLLLHQESLNLITDAINELYQTYDIEYDYHLGIVNGKINDIVIPCAEGYEIKTGIITCDKHGMCLTIWGEIVPYDSVITLQ